jgi:transposase InsO family protein
MIEQFPFPIQRIQCDRGREFFAIRVQEKLMEYSIKFRPIKPASPHLNGKVERSQQTDLREFYANADLSSFANLKEQLKEWQFCYNYQRPHGSLGGKTPAMYSGSLVDKTPAWEDVIATYDQSKEHIQEQNYKAELALRKLKRSM